MEFRYLTLHRAAFELGPFPWLVVARAGRTTLLAFFLAALKGSLLGQTPSPVPPPSPADSAVIAIWRNPDLPIGDRVKALMLQLTMKEKISLINWLAPAIDRLGMPEYNHGNECLHGLVRPGNFTVFPEAIGLGATFDPDSVHAMTSAISDEARAKWNAAHGAHLGWASDVLTLWSPVVNMARDPRWGRTQETYGEDPWLTGRLGVAFVRGLQGDDPHYIKVISTPKHFAANNQEDGRGEKNIVADERYLQEYELAGFRACIMEGKAQSTMAAYTAINGVPSAANKWLLTDVLRGMWGFDGYVVSDCGAVANIFYAHHYTKTPEEAVADSLNAGLDLDSDGMNEQMQPAIDKGLLKPETVDLALSRVLTGRFRLGMYDPPERVPFSSIAESVIRSPEHIALARKLADESIVLLKNVPVDSNPLLPIDLTRMKKIVVVGPNADTVQLGDYSGSPINPVSPLQGLRDRAKTAGITLTALPWQSSKLEAIPSSNLTDPSGATGLKGEYYSSVDLGGSTAGTRMDPQLNFDWTNSAPDPLANAKEFSARWTGSIHTVVPGIYTFSIVGDGGFRFSIDGNSVIDTWGNKNAKRDEQTWKSDVLNPGAHTIKLEYHHNGGDTGISLRWSAPVDQHNLDAAKDADVVVAVMGINTDIESEGHDRKSLSLPPEQDKFVQQLMTVNPHTVVVLESGSPLAVPWMARNVPALVEAWYPGEQGGNAIADILFGDANPSGRLPLTFYASDSQLRPIEEYDLTKGRTYMYLRDKPLYAFGHGLSYTSFKYGNLKFSAAPASNRHITATLDVTNTGTRDGDEIVQGYVHAEKASVPMPIKQLWAFQRVSIPAAQTKTVALDLDTKNFGHWDKVGQKFVVEPGKFDILVGAASDDIRQSAGLIVP